MSGDITVTKSQLACGDRAKLTKEQVEVLLSILPLARLIPAVAQALEEDGEERGTQNLLAFFQLRTLRAMWYLLDDRVPNMHLAFPVILEPLESGFVAHWIGECDSCGIGDSEAFEATTQFVPSEDGISCTIKLTYSQVAWHGSADEIRQRASQIVQFVPPHLFNETLWAFIAVLGVYTACPKREFEDVEDVLGHHPVQCELCSNDGQVKVEKLIRGKFDPATWFGTMTGFFQYGTPK